MGYVENKQQNGKEPSLSVITLYVNGLYTPMKGRQNGLKKNTHDPTTQHVVAMYKKLNMRFKDMNRLKMKEKAHENIK